MTDKTYEQILALELARQCGASIFKSNNGDRLYTTVTFDIDELQVFAALTAAQSAQPDMPQLVGVANGVFGGRPCIKLLNPSLILPEGTALYAHIHFIAQPVQPASPELPEPVAHIYPSDLERFQESETFGHAYSVAVGNPDERSVPLYTLSQLVKYAAIAQSVQPKATS